MTEQSNSAIEYSVEAKSIISGVPFIYAKLTGKNNSAIEYSVWSNLTGKTTPQ